MSVIYHLARRRDWEAAAAKGTYLGTADDVRDGFIHFSTADQIVESAARHRRGEKDLLLVAVDADRLDSALRWEEARGGALFPHLYSSLCCTAVLWTKPLLLGDDGLHRFPPLD